MSFDGGWQSHEKDQIGQAFTAKTDKNQVLVKCKQIPKTCFQAFQVSFHNGLLEDGGENSGPIFSGLYCSFWA